MLNISGQHALCRAAHCVVRWSYKKIQSQALHHVTLVGAGRQTSIDFWQGLLGMPFVFEQLNLDDPDEGHLYFDPGDVRLITVFTNKNRTATPDRTPTGPGCVHHVAFAVSAATFSKVEARLKLRGIGHSGAKDRGFMNSIYFKDPLGLLVELACYKFDPPAGTTHAEVLACAFQIRIKRGAYAIEDEHIADAIEKLVAERSLSVQPL